MAYTIVQHTNSPTFGSNLTGGNAAFVMITYTSSFTLTAVTGTTNGAYTQATTFSASTGRKLEIWYKANVTAGAETVSFTGIGTGGTNVKFWGVAEVNGLGTSFTVDVTAGNNNGNPLTFTFSPTGADLIMSVEDHSSGSTGTLTNLTQLDTLNAANDYWGSTAGSGSITCSDAGITVGSIVGVAFKPAGGGNVIENVSGNLLVTGVPGAQVGIPVAPLNTGVLSLTGRVIVQGFTPPSAPPTQIPPNPLLAYYPYYHLT